MVGASVFYNDVTSLDADSNKPRSASQSSLDRLDQELKVKQYSMLSIIKMKVLTQQVNGDYLVLSIINLTCHYVLINVIKYCV